MDDTPEYEEYDEEYDSDGNATGRMLSKRVAGTDNEETLSIGSDFDDDQGWEGEDADVVEDTSINVRLDILCADQGVFRIPSDMATNELLMSNVSLHDQRQMLNGNDVTISTSILEGTSMQALFNARWKFNSSVDEIIPARDHGDGNSIIDLFTDKKWNHEVGLHFELLASKVQTTEDNAIDMARQFMEMKRIDSDGVTFAITIVEGMIVMCRQCDQRTVEDTLVLLIDSAVRGDAASSVDERQRLTKAPVSTGDSATMGLMGRFAENVVMLRQHDGSLSQQTTIIDRLTNSYQDELDLAFAVKGILRLPLMLAHREIAFIENNDSYVAAIPHLQGVLDGTPSKSPRDLRRAITTMRKTFTSIGGRLKIKIALSSYILRCSHGRSQFKDDEEAAIALMQEISIGFSRPVTRMHDGILIEQGPLDRKYVLDGNRGRLSATQKVELVSNGTPFFTGILTPEMFTDDELSKLSPHTSVHPVTKVNHHFTKGERRGIIQDVNGGKHQIVLHSEYLRDMFMKKFRDGTFVDVNSAGAARNISFEFPSQYVPFFPGIPDRLESTKRVDELLLNTTTGDMIRISNAIVTKSTVNLAVSSIKPGARLQSYEVEAVAFTLPHKESVGTAMEQRRFWNALKSVDGASLLMGGSPISGSKFVRIPKGPIESMRSYRTKTIGDTLASDFSGVSRKFCQVVILLYDSMSALVLAEADEYRKLSIAMCGKILDGNLSSRRQPMGCAAKPYSSSWTFTLPHSIRESTMDEVCYTLVGSLYVVNSLVGTIDETLEAYTRFKEYGTLADGSTLGSGSALLTRIIESLGDPDLIISPLNYPALDNTASGMRARDSSQDASIATDKVMNILQHIKETSTLEYFKYDEAFMYSGDIVAITRLGRSILDRILSDVMKPNAVSLHSFVDATYKPSLASSLPGVSLGPFDLRSHCIARLVHGGESCLLIFGIRGTDPLDPVDVYTDLELTRGRLDTTDRFRRAQEAFLIALNLARAATTKPLEVMITGHSLGGSIAAKLLMPNPDSMNITNVMIVTFARGGGPSMNVPVADNEVPLRNIGDPISLPSRSDSINLGRLRESSALSTIGSFIRKVIKFKAHSMESFADNYYIAPGN